MIDSSKYVLITGATSGIGYELAKLFAKNSYNLVIVARSQHELDNRALEFKQFGIKVITMARDLFNPENTFSLYEELKEKEIDIEILVNDAGQGVYGEFKNTSIERELNIINLNISSLVILTKLVLKEMVARNSGKILNLASVASKLPGPWQAVYHGTKAFVLLFTEAIREELKSSNVSITALMPGVTDTDFFNKAEMLDSKAVADKDKMADPANVAKDGYDALMAGKGKVVSGFNNKMQVAMSSIIPDSKVAQKVNEQQKPVQNEKN